MLTEWTFSWHIYGSRCRHFQLLPVTPSFLPRSQNSSTTDRTSMTSPTKRGNSSETLGQKSKTARTTEPASIVQGLRVDQYLRLRHSGKFVSSQKHLQLSHIHSESKTLPEHERQNSVTGSCPELPETPHHVKHAAGAKGLQQWSNLPCPAPLAISVETRVCTATGAEAARKLEVNSRREGSKRRGGSSALP